MASAAKTSTRLQAEDSDNGGPPTFRRRGRMLGGWRFGELIYAVLAILLGLVILAPIVTLAAEFLQTTTDLETLNRITSRPAFRRVIFNTLLLMLVGIPVGTGLGVAFALLIERTDVPIPGKLARALPMVSLLMPPLIGAIGWVLLFAPNIGFITVIFRALGLPEFSIFSYPGVLAAATFYLVPYSYALCAGALANMSSEVEEAARMSGAGPLRTLSTITVPLIRPALTGAVLIVAMMAMSEFSIPLIIGHRWGFSVLTVEIYRAARGVFPPDYVTASLLGMAIMLVSLLGIYLQRRMLSQGSYETVAGKGQRTNRIKLGPWRYPASVLIYGYLGFVVFLPIVGVVYVSFMPVWTAYIGLDRLTFANFEEVIANPMFFDSLGNSTQLAIGAATIAVIAGTIVAFVLTSGRGKRLKSPLDYVSNLPLGVPNLVLAVGLLIIVTRHLPQFYGGMLALLVAYILFFSPYAVRAANGGIRQMGSELREAAHMSGARFRHVQRDIVLPLMAPSLRMAWILIFVISFRELSASALLSSANSRVVSRVLLDLHENGNFPTLAAFSTLVLIVNLAVIGLAFSGVLGRGRRLFRERSGAERSGAEGVAQIAAPSSAPPE